MGRLINWLRGDTGQALVELAFVIPIVLLFLFAIIDFGLAMNTQNTDTNLANLAARNVSVMTSNTLTCPSQTPATEPDLQSWVRCAAAAQGVNTGSSVSPTLSACVTTTAGYGVGDPVTIKVTRQFNWVGLIGGLRGYLNGLDSSLSSSATMRVEQTPSPTANSFLTPAC